MYVSVPLSKLLASRRNPRRVKPEREAHRRLVASIRAHGLLEPLVVRPDEDEPKHYQVIAGKRRLDALREVHRRDGDPKIPCVVRRADDESADAISLSENFAREPMHPLDEAHAFAHLAREEAKGVEVIAAEFGVSEQYVRQRMKLATLADPIQAACRKGEIDLATAEAFTAVPEDRQLEIWKEVNGHPQHANHVRNIVANGWIDAAHALFDVSKLPDNAVSRDLFNDRVLVERQAFMEAQSKALLAERQGLVEDGWNEVVVAPQSDVQDRLWSMAEAEPEYDDKTNKKLAAIEQRWEKVESKIAEIEDGDEEAYADHQEKLDALEAEAEALKKDAPKHYGEATKAHGTAFLILDPDGRVRRQFRVPRQRGTLSVNGNGHAGGTADGSSTALPPAPTSDELSDRQTGTTFTHEALAVREALLADERALKRVLVLALHEKVRTEALAIRREPNGTDLHADHTEGFTSAALDALRKRRAKLDPLAGDHSLSEEEAYEKVRAVTPSKLDELIRLLAVECLTAHLVRVTPLVRLLAKELGVQVRRHWRPDAVWLNSYRKCQLAHLIGELRGPAHVAAAEQRKKSELVAELANLFVDAAEGRLEDRQLADHVNGWLPANLRDTDTSAGAPAKAEAA
jgi:ParB family chromosome partitioning protein